MREDILKEVLREKQELQARNEAIATDRAREIREKYPDIAELLRQRQQMIQAGIFGALRGEAAAENLPERMEQASGEIRQALQEKGYPADYLAPIYDCPLCQDTGFIGERIKEKCSCVRKNYQTKLRAAIGLPEGGDETFERFQMEIFPDEKRPGARLSQREAMGIIRKACETWADQYPDQQPRDLILAGKSGLGKTFLLHAMANRLIEREKNVLLISAYSFLEIARRSYFENDGQLEELIGTEILMLDDLGSEPMMQNITIEQLFNLINERQRRNLPTVISTNLNQEELRGRYSERIASRLTDRRSCLYLPLEGQDIRNGRK
ncbi:MAG: ATP-binding protein [Clostridia bacterium]|nr:ATP-binding protein [Clostridia bacterium]